MRTGCGIQRFPRARALTGVVLSLGISLAPFVAQAASRKAMGTTPVAAPTSASSASVGRPSDPMIQGGDVSRYTPDASPTGTMLRFSTGLSFDTRAGEPTIASDLRVTSYGEGPGYYIVQMRGPILPEHRAALESAGAKILQYQPEYAFIVRADAQAMDRIKAFSEVGWTGLYQPAYKISRLFSDASFSKGTIELKVKIFQDENFDEALAALRGVGAQVLQSSHNDLNAFARVSVDAAARNTIAALRQVEWIEPYRMHVLQNSTAQWITQTHISNNRAIWGHGIQGEGQVVSTSDTGIRTTHQQFADPLVPISAGTTDYPTHRKIIGYKTMPGATFGDENSSFTTYHGTHTAGTSCGDDSYVGGASLLDGLALKAKMYHCDIGTGAGGTLAGIPLDLNDMFIFPYTGNAGGAARLMSNSWGFLFDPSVAGVYESDAQACDQFMWDHKDFLIFFSNGNSGLNGVGSVTPPATAKDIVSVGGTDNTSGNTVNTQSSQGPCDDGRVKPTICTPGFSLNSANGASNTTYHVLGGTSMASPGAMASTALIRQYLNEGWYPSGAKVPADAIASPSGSLMKALLVNSTDILSPFGGPYTGWGRVDLDSVLFFSGDSRDLALVDNTSGLTTGDQLEYKVNVTGNTIPFKVTLCWTDYPAALTSSTQLVNNLNLTVISPTSLTYLGNVISGAGESNTGGSADNVNVEETVRKAAPEIGVWTIRVNAANVPTGPQPFSIAVSGDLARTTGLLKLDKPAYGFGEVVQIRLEDTTPALTMPSVMFTSTSMDTETVVLSDVGGGVFTGSLAILAGVIASNDGQLSVTNGDVITATYEDASAAPATIIATALIDATRFEINTVRATSVGAVAATINWNTTDNATSQVYYGTSTALGSSSTLNTTEVQTHAQTLTGLAPFTVYYYDVESKDNRGNLVRDDNGGRHYSFSTGVSPDVYLVLGDDSYVLEAPTANLLDKYKNAFVRKGWSYDYTIASVNGDPPLGNKTSGLRSYPVVWWSAGVELYPQISDAQRTIWGSLHDGGARLVFDSHDVVWDLASAGGQDFNAQRQAWVNNTLHVSFKNDPADVTFLGGIASDPISGAYTTGVSYLEARSGGAVDEVAQFNGTGTGAYVWIDDATPDNVGVRWTSAGNMGSADSAAWGGQQTKAVTNCFLSPQINGATADDLTRADIVENILVWLLGRTHPTVTLSAPTGGSTFTTSPVTISWTASAAGGFTIASTTLQYSQDFGQSWATIASGAVSSPYLWDITGVVNSPHTRVRVLVADNGNPALHNLATSGDFVLNRAGGDILGPVVVAGSTVPTPVPVTQPATLNVTAAFTDTTSGGSNIHAAEYSVGGSPAPAGTGYALTGTFDTSPNTSASATVATGPLSCTSCTMWFRAQDAALNWGPATAMPFVVRAGSVVGVGDGPIASFRLAQNMPNPFSPLTTINFSLARDGRAALRIYDTNGALVRTVFDAPLAVGPHVARWDGVDGAGRMTPAGVYYYRLETGGAIATRKMVKMR